MTQARPKCSRIPNQVGTHGLQSRVSKCRLSKARNESRRSIDRASGGNGVVTDPRGAASHTGCKLPHTNYKATRTLLTRQPASVHVRQNLSPVCLKICGAVAGLVAESELAYNNRSIFSSLNSQTILESLLPSLKFQCFLWSIL